MKLRIILPGGTVFDFDLNWLLEIKITDELVRALNEREGKKVYTIDIDKTLEHLKYDIQAELIEGTERLMEKITPILRPELERINKQLYGDEKNE